MLAAGLVLTDGVPTSEGARFRLDPDLVEELDRAIRAAQPEGWVLAGHELVWVEPARLLDLERGLRHPEIARVIVWAAELEGGRYALALDLKADPTARDRVRAALEAQGVACSSGRVTDVRSAVDLRRRVAAWRDAAERSSEP